MAILAALTSPWVPTCLSALLPPDPHLALRICHQQVRHPRGMSRQLPNRLVDVALGLPQQHATFHTTAAAIREMCGQSNLAEMREKPGHLSNQRAQCGSVAGLSDASAVLPRLWEDRGCSAHVGMLPSPASPPHRHARSAHLATSEKAGECAKDRTPLRCTPTVAASTPRSRSSTRSVESSEELTRPASAAGEPGRSTGVVAGPGCMLRRAR